MKKTSIALTGLCLSLLLSACGDEKSSDGDNNSMPVGSTSGTSTGTGGVADDSAPGADDMPSADDSSGGGSGQPPGDDSTVGTDDSSGGTDDSNVDTDDASGGTDDASGGTDDSSGGTDDMAADDMATDDTNGGTDDMATDDSTMMDDMATDDSTMMDDMATDDSTMMDDMADDGGPPEGAYEACSGTPFPALQLTEVIGGLDSPVHAVTPAGDASTMFVAERGGSVKRFDISQADPSGTELLSFNASTTGECGLLSIALHPNFDGAGENRLYVSHNPSCSQQGGSSAIDVYTVSGDSATQSGTLYETMQPESNHNGGLIAFGPDGYLYFGLGDGGGSNDMHGMTGNGQNPNVPLGSILRLDVDAPDTPPAGNLSSDDVGGASVDSRILHYGLRNPWRFSFDRVTDDLYIGDVGQNTWEEISFAAAGSGPINFGWAAREGFEACPGCGNKQVLSGTTAVDPIHSYPTDTGQSSGFFNGSVTGGFVYRGSNIPALYGRYIFGEYVRGEIFALTYDGNGGSCDVVDEAIPGANLPAESLASFAEDADGELYLINMARGTISRIDPQ